MNRKQWLITIFVAFFIGAVGSITLGRFFIPYLAQKTGWQSLNKLVSSSPIVINRTSEVQLNEGVNLVDLTKQASNITVSIYATENNPSYIGNGIIMTSDGLIFTSKNILTDRKELSVLLNNGTSYKATVRAVDPKSDIAALTIDAKDLSAASFSNASDLEVGHRLLAIGDSNSEFNNSLAQGFVTNRVMNADSQLWRPYTTEVLENTFETDAEVNNGRFIGSPIINLNGKVVGMITGSSMQKIITTENLQTALNSYLSSGKITRPRLGVTYFNLSKSLAGLRGFDRAGVLVAKVDDGSPAAGKLLVNDYIFEVDGQKVENQSFEQMINQHSIAEVKFKVLRANKEQEISVTLTPTK